MRRSTRALTIAVLLSVPPAGAAAQATEPRDVIELKSGKQLKGRILRRNDTKLWLRVGSLDREVALAEIKAERCIATAHRALLATWQDISPDDTAALEALSAQASKDGLTHEARLFLWYALLQRPDDAALHRALGNRLVKERWHVELGSHVAPFAEADARGVDFASAWRLRSEHFAVRCAAGLRAGLDALMALEGLYWQFHELYGAELQLLELLEPIDVMLYRDRAQMPNLSNNVGAWFDYDAPALFTCMEDGKPHALVHEGTHALQHFFFERAAKAKGRLPSWVHEGWAEYLDGRLVQRVPGKLTRRDGSVQGHHLQTLAAATAAKDLLSVQRVLNLGNSDFMASTQQGLKYAQAWALFRHLAEHQEPHIRRQFFEYLRDAAAGRGQASTFRRIFSKQERALETDPWR